MINPGMVDLRECKKSVSGHHAWPLTLWGRSIDVVVAMTAIGTLAPCRCRAMSALLRKLTSFTLSPTSTANA
jgi:hypothetical protein